MRKYSYLAAVLVAVGLMALTAAAQTTAQGAAARGAAQATAGGTPALAVGTRMNARLKTTLDAHKARVGQPVAAVLTSKVKQDGRVVLPKGTKLVGHVTEVSATPRGRGASSIGVLFTQALPKHGPPVALAAGISAVFRSAAMLDEPPMGPGPMGGMPGEMPGGMAGAGGARGGVLGGVAAPVGATAEGAVGAAGTVGATAGRDAGLGANGNVLGSANGALRDSNGRPLAIRLPSLAAMATGATSEGSVLIVPRGYLRLNSGTDVQLETLGAASASGRAQGSASVQR